jgi:hypothetical protein
MLSRNVLVIGREDFPPTLFGITGVQIASGFGEDNPAETAWCGAEEAGDTPVLVPMQSESSVFGGSSSFPGRMSGSGWLDLW